MRGVSGAALSVAGLHRRFGEVEAVKDVSFEVRRGMVYGLLGPNGAGKTTTLRMIMGILAPDRGTVTCNGVPIGPQTQRRMGYLPEERGLYAGMRVAEQVAFFAALRGMESRELRHAATRGLALLGLTQAARRRTDELSHGMQQLLQVAVALVHDPEIVVLDEPFSGLDPVHVDRLVELIGRLKAGGKAVLLSTHAMERAEELCDRVAFLNRGEICAEGPLDEVRGRGGSRMLRVRFEGAVPALGPLLPGLRTSVQGTTLLVEWPSSQPPHEIIARLSQAGRITEFELRPPRLRELFVQVLR